MKEPLASAVIITYNQKQYIEQTIECALAQKVDFEYEIIIGEDCSTDKTREICLRYQEQYPDIIRVITSDKNVGLLENWNRSVNAARGKYIAGCGGDDYWHNPDKIQKQVHFLEENPDYGMVHSGNDYLLQESETLKRKKYLSPQVQHNNDHSVKLLHLIILGQYQITASTALFKKQLFQKYFNLDEIKKNGFLMEDTPLWIEVAEHSAIYYLAESLATYRIHQNSISQCTDKRQALQFKKNNTEMCLYYCQKFKVPDYIRKNHEKNWRNSTLQLAFIEKCSLLAKQVKDKYPNLSIKELIWYQGAMFPLIRPLVLILRKLFQRNKVRHPWV